MLSLSLLGNFINIKISSTCSPERHIPVNDSLSGLVRPPATLSSTARATCSADFSVALSAQSASPSRFLLEAWLEASPLLRILRKGRMGVKHVLQDQQRVLSGTTGSIRVKWSQMLAVTVTYEFLRLLAFLCLHFSFL